MEERPRNPTFILTYRAVALLMLALVLGQALIAGRYLFVDPSVLNVHEVGANAITVVAIVQLLLAMRAGFLPHFRIVWWSGLLLALIVVQTGLGYIGRDNSEIAAVHIPNGVLIFGVAMLNAVLAFLDNPEEEPD